MVTSISDSRDRIYARNALLGAYDGQVVNECFRTLLNLLAVYGVLYMNSELHVWEKYGPSSIYYIYIDI